MLKNTLTSYGQVTKILHWLMAILFIMMFIIAYIMINIPKSEFRDTLYNLHKATGLLLFGLAGIRIIWRFINIQPQLTTALPLWQHHAARLNIIALYFFMFAMPMTGFLTSTLGGHDISFYNIFIISPFAHNKMASELFSEYHEILSYLLILVFSLHVLASLYHHYIIKDQILKRMWIS